VTKQDNCIFAD